MHGRELRFSVERRLCGVCDAPELGVEGLEDPGVVGFEPVGGVWPAWGAGEGERGEVIEGVDYGVG